MSEVKFKVGDLVYCPKFTNKIVRLEHRDDEQDFYTLQFAYDETSTATFANNGIENLGSDLTPIIFHATQEKYELLSKLHPNVEFEPPPKRKEPKEIIKAMLESGKWFLVNYRGYGKLGNPPKNKSVTKEQFKKMDMNNYFNKNAFVNVEVFCPNTGKTIIDFVDGEVVLESEK